MMHQMVCNRRTTTHEMRSHCRPMSRQRSAAAAVVATCAAGAGGRSGGAAGGPCFLTSVRLKKN